MSPEQWAAYRRVRASHLTAITRQGLGTWWCCCVVCNLNPDDFTPEGLAQWPDSWIRLAREAIAQAMSARMAGP